MDIWTALVLCQRCCCDSVRPLIQRWALLCEEAPAGVMAPPAGQAFRVWDLRAAQSNVESVTMKALHIMCLTSANPQRCSASFTTGKEDAEVVVQQVASTKKMLQCLQPPDYAIGRRSNECPAADLIRVSSYKQNFR